MKIEVYKDNNGREPYLIWLYGIRDRIITARILNRISLIESDDYLGDYKNIGNGVFELRFFFGSGYRVYFGIKGNTIIILLCGGDKSSQSKDIAKAKEYWQDYKEKSGD